MNLGLQTFTVRHEQKRSIKRAYLPLIELGIKSFELARLPFREENGDEISELISEYGIEISAMQVKPKYVYNSPKSVAAFAERVGCKRIIISMMPFNVILGSKCRFYDFVSTLDPLAEKYAEMGLTLGYHHHNWEYIPTSSGRLRMDELLRLTEKIGIVTDTYWTASCGIDPAAQITRLGSRLLGIHLRDLSHSRHLLAVNSCDCAVGQGVIDFASVMRAASEHSPYLVIEQNSKNPLADIAASYRHLTKIIEETT